MEYELAKELKDAGFPQEIVEGSFYWAGRNPEPYCWGGEGEDKPYGEYINRPSLSELIEACGEKFRHLAKWKGGNSAGDWNALAVDHEEVEWGATPEEAVARLWLALNKK